MFWKQISSSIWGDERHPESHKTLALRSQNALPRAAHPSWPSSISNIVTISWWFMMYITVYSVILCTILHLQIAAIFHQPWPHRHLLLHLRDLPGCPLCRTSLCWILTSPPPPLAPAAAAAAASSSSSSSSSFNLQLVPTFRLSQAAGRSFSSSPSREALRKLQWFSVSTSSHGIFRVQTSAACTHWTWLDRTLQITQQPYRNHMKSLGLEIFLGFFLVFRIFVWMVPVVIGNGNEQTHLYLMQPWNLDI